MVQPTRINASNVHGWTAANGFQPLLRYLRRYSWSWIWSRMPSFASCRCQFCQFDRPKTRGSELSDLANRFRTEQNRTEHFQSCFLCVTSHSSLKLGGLEDLRKHEVAEFSGNLASRTGFHFEIFSCGSGGKFCTSRLPCRDLPFRPMFQYSRMCPEKTQ